MKKSQYEDTIRELTIRQPAQTPAAQQVLQYLNTLMGSVSIDTDALARELEDALMDNQMDDRGVLHKLANTLTRLFGMSLVSRGDCLKISAGPLGTANASQLLKVDQKKAADLIAAITGVVDDCENSRAAAATRIGQLEGALSTASRDADTVKQEQSALRKAQDRKDRDILKAVQRILAQNPDIKPAGDNEKDALLLFLEDLELTWSWDAEKEPDAFTTYTISDPAQTGVRMPCLYRDEKVVAKGLRYTLGDQQ